MKIPSSAEWHRIVIIEKLKHGSPEALMTYMREDGDMSQFEPWQFDVIENALRGKSHRGRGRPTSSQDRITILMFEIAWSEMEGFPLSDPNKSRKKTAFEKASEAVGFSVSAQRAKRIWDDADNREFYRQAVRN